MQTTTRLQPPSRTTELMMNKLQLAPALVLLLVMPASSAAAQGIPVDIPDLPGESPADREREWLEERHMGTLSRIFTTGSFDVGPATGEGAAYQGNVNLGLDFRNGDAVFVFVSTRRTPADFDGHLPRLQDRESVWYYGVGYEMSAARFLGPSTFADRSALNLGLGAQTTGGVDLLAFEIAPTYDLFEGDFWRVPAGLKLSLTHIRDGTSSLTNGFLGLTVGVRRQLGRREKLETRQ